jgi:hypothetical protein
VQDAGPWGAAVVATPVLPAQLHAQRIWTSSISQFTFPAWHHASSQEVVVLDAVLEVAVLDAVVTLVLDAVVEVAVLK